jgi:hypothetical protein
MEKTWEIEKSYTKFNEEREWLEATMTTASNGSMARNAHLDNRTG